MSEYKDYRWENESFTRAHSYLVSPIMKCLPKDGSPILDVGCGNGALANFLIREGYNVYGTDASVSGINIANEINPGRFFIQDLSVDELPAELQNIAFKTIISTEVVEHLYDPRKYASQCKHILSEGGKLIISTPYNGYWKSIALSILGAMDKHHTVLWDGGHIKFWSRKTLSKLLEEQEFRITKFIGCGRLPYLWKSMVIVAEV